MASSSMHDNEYGSSSSRDMLAETFITSFFGMQGEVAKAVQKGLSTFFDLDAYLRRCQQTVEDILAKLALTVDETARTTLVKRLDDLLDQMCVEQTRGNQTWSTIDEQMTASVAETESHWRKAEPFFRSKQKRGVDPRTNVQPDFRGKARKILPVVPMKLTPIGGDIVRPSLIPKKPSLKTSSSKTAHVEVTRKRSSSASPERIRTKAEKKMKTTLVTVKKSEKKDRDFPKEKKQLKVTVKKRRVIRTVTQKRTKRDDSEENSATDDSLSSDPPYRTPSEAVKGNYDGTNRGRHDPDEPVYCVCRNISYGQMVGCDNDNCVIEWFHFVCVQLKAKPRGKWYCPSCRDGDNCKMMKNQAASETAAEPTTTKTLQ